jgi:thioredoxin-like negative regulator of GroEL
MEYSAAVNGVAAALFMGPAILTWRGFILRLKEIGKRLMEQGKYAQAARALEPFTRFGNRSFDLDGEAHYRLALAYLRLGEREKAGQIVAYLNRYRRGSRWQQEAETAWNAGK